MLRSLSRVLGTNASHLNLMPAINGLDSVKNILVRVFGYWSLRLKSFLAVQVHIYSLQRQFFVLKGSP